MPIYVWYLWIAPNVLCGAALVLAFRRNCLNTLPVFCSSLGYLVLQFIAGIALLHTRNAYPWFVLITDLLSDVLELAMIYELSTQLIPSHSPLAAVLKPLPRSSVALILLGTTVLAALFRPLLHNQALRAAMTLNFSTNLIVVGLLLTLLLLVTRIVGISWRGLPAGIALGIGISATGELAGAALFGQPGRANLGDIIRLVSWHVCVLVWFLYLLLPEKVANVSESAIKITKLEPHSQELQKLFQP